VEVNVRLLAKLFEILIIEVNLNGVLKIKAA
jgi:hypothetical protein